MDLASKRIRLLEMSVVTRPGNDCELRARDFARHLLIDGKKLVVMLSGEQQGRDRKLRKMLPQTGLSAGAHASQAVRQAMWIVPQALQPLLE